MGDVPKALQRRQAVKLPDSDDGKDLRLKTASGVPLEDFFDDLESERKKTKRNTGLRRF